MPLGMKVSLVQATLCYMGSQLSLKGAQPPVFSPCLLWPNGWMDEDATWHGSRPGPRPHCVRRGPSSPRERGTAAAPPLFTAHVYCGHGRPSQLLLSSCTAGYVKLECGFMPNVLATLGIQVAPSVENNEKRKFRNFIFVSCQKV